MPAFSATDAYKEAAGFPREYANWQFEQFKQALDRAQRANSKGDWLTDFVTEYLLNNQDAPSPEEIAAMGDRIMPGLGAALAKRQQNLQQISDSFGNVRGRTGDATSRIQDNLNAQAGDISRTGDTSQSILDTYFGRAIPRAEDAHNDIISNLQGGYGRAGQGINDTFGSLRGQNSQVGRNLLDSTNASYDRSRDLSSGTTRDLLDSAGKTFDDLGSERQQTFDRLQGNAARDISGMTGETRDAYGNMRGTAGRVFSGLQGDTDSTYGKLYSDSESTYGKLADSGGKSFDESMAETDLLKPAGEAQQARVARSFAPVVANAKQRLRSSGVSEDDAQAISQLADVEAKRAALMDDTAAASTGDYVSRRADIRAAKQGDAERLQAARLAASERANTGRLNTTIDLSKSNLANDQNLTQSMLDIVQRLGLTKLMNGQQLDLSKLDQDQQMALNRELNKQGLSLADVNKRIALNENENARGTDIVRGQLDREIGLGTGQTDRSTKLEQDLQDRYSRQMNTNLQNLQGLDKDKAAADIGLQDTQYARTQQWRDAGNQAALLQRAMEQQDWQTAANILNQDSQEQLTALELKNLAYSKGNDYVTQAFNRKNAMMGNLQGMAGSQYARADANYAQANRAGQAAQGAYQQTAQQEAGKGGWGTRLLVGGATAGLNAIVPGLGTVVGGAAGGALGGSGAMGGGWPSGGGYGSGQSQSNPYVFHWQNPFATQGPRRTAINIDNNDLYAGG